MLLVFSANGLGIVTVPLVRIFLLVFKHDFKLLFWLLTSMFVCLPPWLKEKHSFIGTQAFLDISHAWITHYFDACWVIALKQLSLPSLMSCLTWPAVSLPWIVLNLCFVSCLSLAMATAYIVKSAESSGCPVSLFTPGPSLPQGKSTVSLYCHGSPQRKEPRVQLGSCPCSPWLSGTGAVLHHGCFTEHLFLQLCFTLEHNVPKLVLLIFSTLPLLWFLLLELVFLALHFSRPSFLICNQLLSKLCIVSSCITLPRPNFSSLCALPILLSKFWSLNNWRSLTLLLVTVLFLFSVSQ